MKTELEQYLESEISFFDSQVWLPPVDIGYLEALTNCLDFIQGAEVYLNWKANQEGNK